MEMELTNRQRKTLEAVFQHPLPRDLRWTDLLDLCEGLGVGVKVRGNTVVFTFRGAAVSCHKPHGKSTEKGAIAQIRNLLRDGGVTPDRV
jgi:hypothetical protein